MIVLAVSLVLLAVIARSIDRRVEGDHDARLIKATRMLLWAFAAVVVVQAGLGAVGLLTPAAVVIGLAALAAGAFALTRRRPPAEAHAHQSMSVLAASLLASLLAVFALRLATGLHKTAFLYDTLSYHLHIPATWMHDRRITIVPAVFGDPSSAYAPANLELWFLFLMAPLRSDYLASVGQLPFAALAAAAIAATVRDAGGYRTPALAGALAFLLIPEVWSQAQTAMTDLGFAACLLATMPFTIRLLNATHPRREELLTIATGIGLAVGTKYSAAPLALPFAALAVAAWLRKRPLDLRGAALALALALATGGFWYVRNAVVTGNPFFPVAVLGPPLPALYGRAEMRAWDYHIPVTDLGALGSMLIDAGVAFACAFVVVFADLLRRSVRAGAGFDRDSPRSTRLWVGVTGGVLVASLAIFWLVIPYQESRFLFAVFGVAAVMLGRNEQGSRIGALALAAAIVGGLLRLPPLHCLLLVGSGAVAAVAFKCWAQRARDLGTRPRRLAAAAGVVALAIALAVGSGGYALRDPGYLVGDDADADWAWFRANVHDANVAYTGTNLAFPLAGQRLSNDVRYVNVAGAPGARLHDFGPPGDGTAEPAPYRRSASADVWLANLRAARTQVLFVAALYPGVRRNIEADSDGFPAERAWADARPDAFHLLHASPSARVYAVTLQ